MADVPHFSHPFAIVGKTVRVDEQHSTEEVEACVARIVVTGIGSRDELPEFGITDPTFEQVPIDVARLAAEVNQWEPRANLAGVTKVDSVSDLISNVTLRSEVQA